MVLKAKTDTYNREFGKWKSDRDAMQKMGEAHAEMMTQKQA